MDRSARSTAMWGLATVLLMLAGPLHAGVWHVSSAGDDAADGSEKTPFLTLTKAMEAAIKAGDATEIVMHAGIYPGDITIPAPTGADAPAWMIRAATKADGSFEEVVIEGGQKIAEAHVVDADRGVYFFPIHLANFEPSMWDAKARERYPFMADRRAVETFPGTLAPGQFAINGDTKGGVFFRTSDSKPPAEHDLGIARYRKGIMVLRPNVTIKGLHFRNFQLYFGVSGVSIEAANVTIDSCHAWNCWGAFMVGEKMADAKIINCTARDVATGVKSYGINTIVENCRFFRIEGPFEVQEYEQDQCGVQFYTSNTQTVRNTLCVGFQAGIFIKASGGVLILENNTVIAGKHSERGIGPNTWRPGSICRGNVVVGYREPITHAELIKDCVISDNLFWLASDRAAMEAEVARIKAGMGGENIVAPPQFVDAAGEDYRLASVSAAATLADGKPIGAMGAAPKDVVAKVVTEEKSVAKAPAGAARPARIVGQPVIYTNDHGAVIVFKTDSPCTAAVEWGTDKNKIDQRVDDAHVYRTAAPTKEEFEAKTPDTASLRTDHSLAIFSSSAGQTHLYRIKLNSGKGEGEPVRSGQFTLKGAARTLHVATTGVDEESAGTAEKPFASIQFAVDRALPGDRVLVAPGVYSGRTWVTHGGVKDHPITIESAESWESPSGSGGAILDGKREHENAFRLGHVANLPETWALGCLGPPVVAHVIIKGFEIRWYNGMSIHAQESQDITVEGCKLWSRHYVKGRPGISEGVGAYHCDRVTVHRNLFFMLNTAVRFNSSAGLRLTSNTVAKCFHRAIGIVGAKDVHIRNNSIAFGGSYLLQIHGVEMGQIDSDYNNFAVHLREDAVGFKNAPPEERLVREENDFYYGESKSLSAWSERTAEKPDPYIATLTPWREITGQDKHSISAHPRYADPQNRDFRLRPNSPNVGKGENGVNIGALEVAKDKP